MTYFRKFNKTICATRLTRPNNLLLASQSFPIYLCTSNQPSIDHLNSVKSFFKTISRLETHQENATYKSHVLAQLEKLKANTDRYVSSCIRYVQNGGRLTAQGLANLYACADRLGLNQKWFQKYVQQEIPHYLRFMNADNLQDVQSGLKKYKGSNDFLKLVEDQIKKRGADNYEYVTRTVHEVAQFQQSSNQQSDNLLINSIEGKSSIVLYYARKLWGFQKNVFQSFFKKPTGYPLN